jgi:hypothetical protein
MADETSEQRKARALRAEVEAFDNDARARAQAVIDRWWEGMMAERDFDDGYEMIGGFRERRRPTCHRGVKDSDWGM